MRRIDFTGQYKKDLKLARKRNLPEDKLNEVIFKLANDEVLPAANRDHALSGDFVVWGSVGTGFLTHPNYSINLTSGSKIYVAAGDFVLLSLSFSNCARPLRCPKPSFYASVPTIWGKS